jgi:hypothetical protein
MYRPGNIPHVSLKAKKKITLMVGAASISETSVVFYQTTWRSIAGDRLFHTRRRENLKSYEAYHFIILM